MPEAATGGVRKKGCSKKFRKFTGKHLRECLFFNKVASQPTTLLKKTLWHKRFPVNFSEISMNAFYTEHLPATASEMP